MVVYTKHHSCPILRVLLYLRGKERTPRRPFDPCFPQGVLVGGRWLWENKVLLNASSGGVLAAVADPPVRGTRIRLVIGDMVLAGQVRWHGVDCCGIALRDPISVVDLLEGHAVPVAFIPQPKALRGLSGLVRAFVGERTALLRTSPSSQ